MNPRVRLLPLLAAVLVTLAACAPATRGSSAGTAFRLGAGDARVAAGGTAYVSDSYKLDTFKLKAKDLSGWMWVPTGYDRSAAVLTTTFDLTDVEVPAGWSLELAEVRATRRTVEGARSFDPATVESDLTATYAIKAPADAVAGPYTLRATLQHRTSTVPVTIELTLTR